SPVLVDARDDKTEVVVEGDRALDVLDMDERDQPVDPLPWRRHHRVRGARTVCQRFVHPSRSSLTKREPPSDLVRWQLPDLVLRELDGHAVRLDLRDRADRDRHLPSSPEVAALEHEVGDLIVVVDEEPVDVAYVVTVLRHHVAGAPNLDLALRDAVVQDAGVPAEAGGPGEALALVVRQREDAGDADVPIGIARRRLVELEVRELLDLRHLEHLARGAVKLDLGAVAGTGVLDRDEVRLAVAVARLDHEVRDALLDRIDHQVRELADDLVRAANLPAELEPHEGLLGDAGG